MYRGDWYPFHSFHSAFSLFLSPLVLSLELVNDYLPISSRSANGLRFQKLRKRITKHVHPHFCIQCRLPLLFIPLRTLTKYLISPSHRPPPTRLLFTRYSSYYSPFPLPPSAKPSSAFPAFFPPASTRDMKPHGFERAPVNVTQKKLRRTTFSGTTVLYFVPTV